MGVWGFYDNENDGVYEEFYTFKLSFIKLNNKKLHDEYKQKNKKSYDEAMEKSLDDYIQKNIIKAAKYLKIYINKLNKTNFLGFIFTDYDNRSSIITGLIIELLHIGKSPKLQTSLPKTLFDKFPVSLQKLACVSINKSLKSVDKEGWKDKNKRINALKEELKLFQCKTTSNTNVKARKSPTESATLFNVGIQKIGNDGNLWIITETKNKIKRWKKL